MEYFRIAVGVSEGENGPLITWLLHVSSLFCIVSTIIATKALEGRINVGSGKINRRSERDFLSSFISIEALPNVSHSLYPILHSDTSLGLAPKNSKYLFIRRN